MLGSLSIELGPLNIPIWLLAAAGGAAVALIVERFLIKRHWSTFRYANDLLITGLIWGFLAWKLTPLATRFTEIAATPLRLLYYPGGTAGIVVGLAAAALAVVFSVIRSRRRALGRPDASGEDGEEAAAPVLSTIVAAAVTVAFVALPLVATRVIPVAWTTKLPAQTVEVLEDGQIREDALAAIADGGPIVLVFWATWCGPCTAQMPEVERFHRENRERVPVIAVNLTTTEPGVEAVRSYLDSAALTMPVVLDRADQLRSALGVSATPTTLLFDADGNERLRRTGAITSSWIERRVLPLIN